MHTYSLNSIFLFLWVFLSFFFSLFNYFCSRTGVQKCVVKKVLLDSLENSQLSQAHSGVQNHNSLYFFFAFRSSRSVKPHTGEKCPICLWIWWSSHIADMEWLPMNESQPVKLTISFSVTDRCENHRVSCENKSRRMAGYKIRWWWQRSILDSFCPYNAPKRILLKNKTQINCPEYNGEQCSWKIRLLSRLTRQIHPRQGSKAAITMHACLPALMLLVVSLSMAQNKSRSWLDQLSHHYYVDEWLHNKQLACLLAVLTTLFSQ